MHTNMEQAVEAYKEILRVYFKKVMVLKAKYGEACQDPMSWGKTDYSYVISHNNGFQMVALVLGLTPEEDVKIVNQIKAEVNYK